MVLINILGQGWVLHGSFRTRVANELKVGCMVDRHLEDGDDVLFNNQACIECLSCATGSAAELQIRTTLMCDVLRSLKMACELHLVSVSFGGKAFSLMCSDMGDGMDSVDFPTPAILKPVELWTRKQLFNVVVQPHANMRVYVSLTVKKKTCSNKLIRTEGDEEIRAETMCSNDGARWIMNHGFSTGLALEYLGP
ncbi:hypothetical protein WN943_001571 [Citrus x changshan-huyou]